jgi:hypothetical protein
MNFKKYYSSNTLHVFKNKKCARLNYSRVLTIDVKHMITDWVEESYLCDVKFTELSDNSFTRNGYRKTLRIIADTLLSGMLC